MGEPVPFLAALAAVHGLGALWLCARLLRTPRLADLPAAVTVTSFATFYGLPLLAAWVSGRISPALMAACAPVPLAVAWASDPRARHLRELLGRVLSRVRAVRVLAWCAAAGPALLILAYLGVTFALASQLPIRAWDAAAYHGTNALRWAEAGAFRIDSFGAPHLDPYLTIGETFPNAKALVPYAVLALSGDVRGTALAQWPFLLLFIGAFASLLRRHGLPAWACLTGVVFCLAVPEVMLQSLEAYADIAYLAGAMAALWSIIMVHQSGARLPHMALAALAFALFASSKPTAYLACGLLGVAYLAVVAADRSFPRAGWGDGAGRVAVALGLTLLAALVLAGPWAVHALRAFGNPVYPVAVKAGTTVLLPGTFDPGTTTEMAGHYLKATGLDLWWRIMREQWREGVLASWGGGLGPHFFILGLPAAAVFLAVVAAARRMKEFALVLVLFGLLTAATASFACARFVLYQAAFAALAFAWIAAQSAWLPRAALIAALAFFAWENTVRCWPSALFRPRAEELTAYAVFSGDSRPAQIDAFPDEFSALDWWREIEAAPGRLLAIPPSHAPWTAHPLARGGSVVRVPAYRPGTEFRGYLDMIAGLGATHLYLRRGGAAFGLALEDRERLRLIAHRADGATLSVLNMDPQHEAALFEIVRPGARP